ncbi:hypothetical protein [Methylobacterium nigriterrae]|uniref:hypothetical protein n=1 Tax=Methylobacterium nigriterrae TaxID=3127512 RepID=UPI0030141A4C
MRRAARLAPALVAASLLPGGAAAAPLEAGGSCGGNAYSSAQLIEGRPPRRGPITSVPDTLCADLKGPRPSVNIDIYGVPGLQVGGQATDGIGSRDTATPYEGQPRRGARSPGSRFRGD